MIAQLRDARVAVHILPRRAVVLCERMVVHNRRGRLAQDVDVRRQQQRLVYVVRYEEDRLALAFALPPERKHEVLKLRLRDGVERSKRLVHQKYRRVDRKGARYAAALLLSAREVARKLVEKRVVHADVAHPMTRALFALFLRHLRETAFEGDHDIFARRHPREKAVVLEDHPALEPRSANRLAVDRQRPPVRHFEPREQPQQRALAAAGLSEQAGEAPSAYVHADVAENDVLCAAVSEFDMVDLNVQHCVVSPPFRVKIKVRPSVRKPANSMA